MIHILYPIFSTWIATKSKEVSRDNVKKKKNGKILIIRQLRKRITIN